MRGGQVGGEPVDPRRDRGVGREDDVGPDPLSSLGQGGSRPDLAVEQLEEQETGVALVEVVDGRLPAQLPERTGATDPQDQLLLDPVAPIAAVEPIGDRSVLVAVPVEIGVEQHQRHTADRQGPDAGAHQPGGDRHVDHDAGVLRAEGGRFVGFVALHLPAARQRLPEEPLAVEEAHAAQRHAQIGGRLHMVAGQDAEPAGVLGHQLGDPEFGREVRDVGRTGFGRRQLIERSELFLDPGDHSGIGRRRSELLGGEAGDHSHRVDRVPVGQLLEEGAELPGPGPDVTAGQPIERGTERVGVHEGRELRSRRGVSSSNTELRGIFIRG